MSSEKGIEALLGTAMNSLSKMINVNTVVGDAIQMGDDVAIVPISKVGLGFVAGGGEYAAGKEPVADQELPFGGGSGGGMSITPIGFLVCANAQVRFIPVEGQMPLEKLVDMAPELLNKIQGFVKSE